MNFQFEQKHVIIVGVVLLVLWILWSWDREEDTTAEKFSPVQQFPYLPPKYWKSRTPKKWHPYWFYDSKYKTPTFLSKWNPLWDSDDQYHPAVPGVVKYDSLRYKLPTKPEIEPELAPEFEEELMPELEEESTSEMEEDVMATINAEIEAEAMAKTNSPEVITSRRDGSNVNMLLIFILLIGGGYWYYTRRAQRHSL